MQSDTDVEPILAKIKFPSHAVCLQDAKSLTVIAKGITDKSLFDDIMQEGFKNHPTLLLSTDMRAIMNPSRMQVIGELAEQFADYKLKDEIMSAYREGVQLVGSLKFTKMMMFANEVKLTNDDIDYFASLRPMQNEDETPETFRQRSKFAKALLKYRPHLYDYSVYEK